MTRYLMALTLAAGLTGAFYPTPAFAAKQASPGQMAVDDKADAFSADGIKKAEEAFHAVTFKSPTHFTVVVYKKVPDGKRAEFEKVKDKADDRKRFFGDWTRELAESRGAKGVFVLVSMEGGHVHAIDDKQTDVRRGFDDKDLRALEKKLVNGFASARGKEGDEAKKLRDEGLLSAAKFVADELKDTSAGDVHSTRSENARGNGGGSGIMGYICIGIVALAAVWLVIGLIRMFTGGGGGGYGPGGGYGGGGGGFMTSMLGGLFGAAAGMYLYDQFFGHHGSDLSAGQGDYGDTSSSYDDGGAGDYSGGGDGGGTDFDSGGGDFGGGDFGGGDF